MVGSFLAGAKLALQRAMTPRGTSAREVDQWSDVAETLDLEIRVSSRGYPSLTGLVDVMPVFVGVRRDAKDRIEHTHYEVQFSPIGSTVTLSRKSNVSFLRTYEEGGADVEVGDRFFDETVVVDSHDPEFIREYLTPARRALVFEVFEHWVNARITERSIVAESIGFESNGDQLIRTIERLVAIAHDLEEPASFATQTPDVSPGVKSPMASDVSSVAPPGVKIPMASDVSSVAPPRVEPRPPDVPVARKGPSVGSRRAPDLPASVAPPRVEQRRSDAAASAGPPRVEQRRSDAAVGPASVAPLPVQAPVPEEVSGPLPLAVPEPVDPRPRAKVESVEANANAVPPTAVPPTAVPPTAVPLPPSLPLPPRGRDDEATTSAQQVVIDDLFESRDGNDILEWFDETYRDREVAWSGEVTEAHTYRRDADFPGGPGVKATVRLGGIGRSELVSSEVQAVVQLPKGANVSRGMTLSFAGVLHKVDRFARKLYVADAEVSER